ncbi:hypothetical protein SAMN02799622_04095 [Methylobacterium sp. UNC378MF]|uniref:hypothetical protein n=1 Tax=Methylobacterium sp. UNC378MF TaxID=1502748 RepID=UPI0008901CAC|nr:hypothetical protein [Methylobacterium sp. UNC378MF]SDA27628.1 hypothetical protein SAMN02799622_04095 [Methylobacterium sp. UNC378MF]
MRRPVLVTFVLAVVLAATAAQAQSGLGNGIGNSGAGNGNGNGNGSNNVLGAAAAAGSSSSVNIGGSGSGRNTPGVWAPGLAAAGIESCLGSASAGGAGPGFGVTIGGTLTDKGCNLRLYARTLYSLGHRVAATQILCNDPDVALALAVEGVPCLAGPGAEVQRSVGFTAPASDYAATSALGAETGLEPAPMLPRSPPKRRRRVQAETGRRSAAPASPRPAPPGLAGAAQAPVAPGGA